MNAEFHHHPAQTKGFIKTLVLEAKGICSSDAYLNAELKHLKSRKGCKSHEIDIIFQLIKRGHEIEQAGKINRAKDDDSFPTSHMLLAQK